MNRHRTRHLVVGLSIALSVPLLLASSGCKKDKPVEDAAPLPVATEPAVVEVAPLEELDAGDAGDGDADAAKKYGTGGSAMGARIRGCCNAISGYLNNPLVKMSPEGAAAKGYLGQCYATASAVDKNPNAPEVAQLRATLAGKPIPGCGGF
jgi:hypothetical protein